MLIKISKIPAHYAAVPVVFFIPPLNEILGDFADPHGLPCFSVKRALSDFERLRFGCRRVHSCLPRSKLRSDANCRACFFVSLVFFSSAAPRIPKWRQCFHVRKRLSFSLSVSAVLLGARDRYFRCLWMLGFSSGLIVPGRFASPWLPAWLPAGSVLPDGLHSGGRSAAAARKRGPRFR